MYDHLNFLAMTKYVIDCMDYFIQYITAQGPTRTEAICHTPLSNKDHYGSVYLLLNNSKSCQDIGHSPVCPLLCYKKILT